MKSLYSTVKFHEIPLNDSIYSIYSINKSMILPMTSPVFTMKSLFFHGEPPVFGMAMAGAVALPRPLAGSWVLELGAGPGLPGLAAAKMGARCLWEQEEYLLFIGNC